MKNRKNKTQAAAGLTMEQARKYLLVRDGGECPYCGSNSITGDRPDMESGRIYQRVKCGTCGRSWTDGYTLDSVADDQGGEFLYPGKPAKGGEGT